MGSARKISPVRILERQVEKAIGDWLCKKGFCFFKQNTRGFFDTKLNRFRKDLSPYALTGLPDYCVIYEGHYIGLEVKSPTGKLQDNQKEFEFYITHKGKALYFMVRSLEEAVTSMNSATALINQRNMTAEEFKQYVTKRGRKLFLVLAQMEEAVLKVKLKVKWMREKGKGTELNI